MSRVIQSRVEACSESGQGFARMILPNVDPFEGQSLRLSIDKGADANSVLGPNGWQSEAHWITPDTVETVGGQTSIVLGPSVTRHLRAGSNFRVKIIGDGKWPETNCVVAWPAIVGEMSDAPTKRRRVTLGSGRAARPEPGSSPDPAPSRPPLLSMEEKFAPKPVLEPKYPPKKGGLNSFILVGALGVLTLVGVGLHFSGMLGTLSDASVTEVPLTKDVIDQVPALWSTDEVRSYLSENPSAATSIAQAEAQLKSGNPDMAFLLYKQAASEGVIQATVALAQMYDPDLHSPETSAMPEPNAERAAELYLEAIAQGEPVALRRLGILTFEGRHGAPADQNAGRALLERAAEAGDADAITYLEELY